MVGAAYLAGLWGGDLLPLQLLWGVYKPLVGGQLSRRAEKYCAPTWSWASLVADIGFKFVTKTVNGSFMIQILECQIKPVADDPLGQVSEGKLHLRGWLRSLLSFQLTAKTLIRLSDYPSDVVAYLHFDTEEEYQLHELFYLPIAENWDPLSPINVLGLVLIQTGMQDGISNQFCRVGLLSSATKWSFLFKPPTHPRTAAELSHIAKIERLSVEKRKEHMRRTIEAPKDESREEYGSISEGNPWFQDGEMWTETSLTII